LRVHWCFGNPDHDRYYLKYHVANGVRDDGRHRRFQQHPDPRITHHLTDDGMPLKEAVQHAVRVRLRPILMTSLATLIGLIPITLALEAASESYAPLAHVIIGGTTRVGQF
jgi:AcrB/AcrD/AcrF family